MGILPSSTFSIRCIHALILHSYSYTRRSRGPTRDRRLPHGDSPHAAAEVELHQGEPAGVADVDDPPKRQHGMIPRAGTRRGCPGRSRGTNRRVCRCREADKKRLARLPATWLSIASSSLAFILSFSYRTQLEFLLLASALGTFLRGFLGSACFLAPNTRKGRSRRPCSCTVSHIQHFPR